MKFDQISNRIGYLEELIRNESTGTPAELARRLQVSERMVYRYINHLNIDQNRVKYCKRSRTYKFIS